MFLNIHTKHFVRTTMLSCHDSPEKKRIRHKSLSPTKILNFPSVEEGCVLSSEDDFSAERLRSLLSSAPGTPLEIPEGLVTDFLQYQVNQVNPHEKIRHLEEVNLKLATDLEEVKRRLTQIESSQHKQQTLRDKHGSLDEEYPDKNQNSGAGPGEAARDTQQTHGKHGCLDDDEYPANQNLSVGPCEVMRDNQDEMKPRHFRKILNYQVTDELVSSFVKGYKEATTRYPLKYNIDGKLLRWTHWKDIGIAAFKEHYPDFEYSDKHTSFGNTVKAIILQEQQKRANS